MNIACKDLHWQFIIAAVICAGSVSALSTAQSRSTANTQGIFITRMYSGADGETYRQDLEVAFSEQSDSAAVSKAFTATGLSFSRSGPMKVGEMMGGWHTDSKSKYSITLTGGIDIEIAGGEKIAVRPGTVLHVDEDPTAKGHRNYAARPEPRLTVQVAVTPLTTEELGRRSNNTMTVMRVRRGTDGELHKEAFRRDITEITRVSGFKFVCPRDRGWRTEHAQQYMTPVRGRAALIAPSGATIPVPVGEVVLVEAGEASPDERALTIGCMGSEDCIWIVFAP